MTTDIPPMTPLMQFFFRAWLGRPKLFGHPADEHRFFLFVKSCLYASKKPRDGSWLRHYLEKEDIADEWVEKAVRWFDICIAYDQSMRYFNPDTTNLHQFSWSPRDYRPRKELLPKREEKCDSQGSE